MTIFMSVVVRTGYDESIFMPKIFCSSEIEQFVEEGYVALREAFPREVAAAIRERLWEKLGLDPNQRSAFAQR
jgi:hypothetical protein